MLEPDEIRNRLPELVSDVYHLPENIQISHLKYSENFTYLISSEEEHSKYVLRVNRPGYHSLEELNSEISWMYELKKDTDIHMAEVLPGKNGERIQKLDMQDPENPYYTCSLFSFVEGESIRDIEYTRLLQYQKVIGSICAKMHLHVLHSEKIRSLPRFSWAEKDLVGKDAIVGDWEISDQITEEQKIVLKQAVEIALKRLEKYGKSSDRYGLIHSDLNINNILVDGDVVNVLDFDDCGYGWFLYDLATSVLEYDDTLEEMIAAWVEGYEQIR
ncbi:MAG: phosphotransferase, partial [Eubacterium sp.]|nr:phosphotransferase [Eubacterium sp.]